MKIIKIDRRSFTSVEKWYDDLKIVDKGDIFIFLVGNKLDIAEREVSQEEALEKARRLNCECFETSAKTNMNINELFLAISEKLSTIEPPPTEEIILVGDKTLKSEQSNSSCC